MSVIVYIESEGNKIKKVSLEAVSYAKKISESLKKDLIAVSFNLSDFSILNNYGVDKLHNISNEYEISIPRLALTFARDIQGIDSLVIGVDDVNQLEKNMNILDSPPLSNKIIQRIYKTFNDVPEEIINPNTWLISKM